MARTLEVYLHRHLVGSLIQNDHGEITFGYAESWIGSPNATPLSHSLPLKRELFTGRECKGFFGGILPEGEKREIIAKNLGISAKNDFAMLDQIGGECAGAVTFIAPGAPLPTEEERGWRLTDHELARLLRSLPRRPLMAGEGDIRLSLAGAQDKIAVYIDGEDISLPLGGSISSHILKPAIPSFPGVVENEAFCMELARQVGLPVPAAMAIEGERPFYLVERYDRRRSEDGRLLRLHQEDFCQALGYAHGRKYEADGGPGLKACFGLTSEQSTQPALDKMIMLRWVIFNYLIGNCDAHAKNLSMLINREEYSSRRFTT